VPLQLYLRVTDTISEWAGKLFSWLILPLVAALFYEVVARYAFNAPTVWAWDMSYMLYGALFMLGAAYTLRLEGHVRVDVFYRLLRPRWRAVIDLLLYLIFFFPAMIVLLKYGMDYAWYAWSIQERAAVSPWRPPIYPLKTVIPVAAFLLLLQGVAQWVRSLTIALRRG
jgi:TRAP-type mannitol/chloroaromatic compound transport system permease small subunit